MSRHVISFMSQFVDKVLSGEKRQTIRAARKRPIKVGDMLILATGARTKYYRKLGEARCLAAFPIQMTAAGVSGEIEGIWEWSAEWPRKLARWDGFEATKDFRAFFETRYGFPFEGIVIRWSEIRKEGA